MSAEALQHEIKRLVETCEQLHSLADEHPFVGEALLGIAGSVRNIVTVLEVLLLTKMVELRVDKSGSN
jgi:hypothetical protein